jgi:hypothetical protein
MNTTAEARELARVELRLQQLPKQLTMTTTTKAMTLRRQDCRVAVVAV